MRYLCLQSTQYVEGLYKLLPLRYEDIFLIMQWRNEQMTILRQNKFLTPEDQEKYYREVIEPTFTQEKPELILFSFLLHGECIGYGGLTHIDWSIEKGEVSFLLATERANKTEMYQNEFRIFLSLLKRIAFDDLGLNELFTETYDIRPKHIEIIEEQGFVFQKKLKEHAPKGSSKLDSVFHTCRRDNG